LAVYSALLNPSRYWIPNGIPALGLGKTVYDASFAVERYSPVLAALAVTMLDRLDDFTERRRGNAAYLQAAMQSLPRVQLIASPPRSEPVYVRFPILVDAEARDRVVTALNNAGIGATSSYPRSLARVPELQSFPVNLSTPASAPSVADRIVTLPTHPFVTLDDLKLTIETVGRALSGTAPTLARPVVVH
jgi:dTDP-4-amino-4,6-dideoxygalactose transaminase